MLCMCIYVYISVISAVSSPYAKPFISDIKHTQAEECGRNTLLRSAEHVQPPVGRFCKTGSNFNAVDEY